jgi:hypothetical protein
MSAPCIRSHLGILALVAAIWSSAAAAQGANVFEQLSGSWAGSGTVRLANGATERLRCDAQYDVAANGQSLRQALRCRSDSYSIDLRTNVTHQGSSISGNWVEVTRNASGTLAGQAGGGQIRASVQGPGFAAGFGLTVRGNQQSININSQGTEVTQVSIVLRRTGGRAAALP